MKGMEGGPVAGRQEGEPPATQEATAVATVHAGSFTPSARQVTRPNVSTAVWKAGAPADCTAGPRPATSRGIRTPEATRPARPSTVPSQAHRRCADYEARRAPLQPRSAYRELESDSWLGPAP